MVTYKSEESSSNTLYFAKPSQAEINDMAAHKAITCYDRLPDKDKDKPGVDSSAYTPNTNHVEIIGATQRPGDRKYGEQ
tara:strand:- start:411 stop:647 length:237 start_codon:yes stop_codon:yes gene_type:complete